MSTTSLEKKRLYKKAHDILSKIEGLLDKAYQHHLKDTRPEEGKKAA